MGIKVQGTFFLGPKAVYGIDESVAVNTVTAVWRLGCCCAWLVASLEKSSSLSQLHCPHLKNKEVDWLDMPLRSIGLHRHVVLEKTLESPLRVPWRSNQSILKEINPEYSLEGLVLKLKLQYFGHLMWPKSQNVKSQLVGKDPDAGKD